MLRSRWVLLMGFVLLLTGGPAKAEEPPCGSGLRAEEPFVESNYLFERVFYRLHRRFNSYEKITSYAYFSQSTLNHGKTFDPMGFYNTQYNTFSTRLSKKYELHSAILEDYFFLSQAKRGFSSERMSLFRRVEDLLPSYRSHVLRIRDLNTSNAIGTIRIFDGSPFLYVIGHGVISDDIFLLPYERALEFKFGTPMQSESIAKERERLIAKNDSEGKIFEIGRVFRDASRRGRYAKALWELEAAFYLLPDHQKSTVVFVHTDALGAALFSREYSLKIVEKIDRHPKDHSEAGKWYLRPQDKIMEDDTPEAEYLMRVDGPTMVRRIIERFHSDPVHLAMARQSQRVRSLHEITAVHFQLWVRDMSAGSNSTRLCLLNPEKQSIAESC